jgi:hypothetical protein
MEFTITPLHKINFEILNSDKSKYYLQGIELPTSFCCYIIRFCILTI